MLWHKTEVACWTGLKTFWWITGKKLWSERLRLNGGLFANLHQDYHMTGANGRPCILEETLVERDLGVNVANTLKPSAHCQIATSKAMSALCLLSISFQRLNPKNLKPLYPIFVRHHLEYRIQAIGPYMTEGFEALEQVRWRATKLVK